MQKPLEVFYEKGVLKNFAKFTGKHLCQSLFFINIAGQWPTILLKKKLWNRYFPVNFAKFLRSPFLWKPSERLLLSMRIHFAVIILLRKTLRSYVIYSINNFIRQHQFSTQIFKNFKCMQLQLIISKGLIYGQFSAILKLCKFTLET